MAQTGGRARTAARARRRAAGAASLLLHVAILAVLVWQLGRQPRPVEPPVIDVRLVTLAPRTPAPSRPPASARRVAVRATAAPASPEVAPAPFQPAPPAPTVEPAAAEVARALRGALGCGHADLMRLSPQERERCRDRLAAGARPLDRKLDLDPSGRFAEQAEPYLQRRPQKGCKPRAGGSRDPMGKEGAAAGITCVIPF